MRALPRATRLVPGRIALTAPGWIALVVLGWSCLAQAQETPLSVTYGPKASTAEGDPDYREVIFLSVPDSIKDRLYVRVFDPDTGGERDLIYGPGPNTETRYRLFGGKGAYSDAVSGGPEPGPKELAAGTVLDERAIGANPALDDRWQTLFSAMPEQGEAVGGRRVFRLQVEGTAGDDANLYSVTLSLRDRRNLAPDGLEIVDLKPTLRVPDNQHVTELRFEVPADAERLKVRNFDAAKADISFVTAFRSVPVVASGQNEWRESEVEVQPDERGKIAALVFGGGEEMPNDVTFQILDQAGQALPIQLPARLWKPNHRPLPEAAVDLLASCTSVAFDASRSSDPDGDQLSYEWAFGDGASGSGRALVHRYPGPGTYHAMLRLLDSSGQVGAGAERPLDVFVKRPPTAVTGPSLVVAPGEPVAFDGTASKAGERPIARWLWDFYDGSSGQGQETSHAFAKPGRYLVTLRVEDDTSPPCNSGTAQQIVQVNARPVAVAGEDKRLSVGQTVSLDGKRSYDVDGKITGYRWDFGDGASATGASVDHAYAAPGTYTATLTVEDDAGVANSRSSDSAEIVVNAPPVAAAGPDRHVAIGEVITFDASASHDPDGNLIGYAWDFGDGARGDGKVVQYAYHRSGVYRVGLTVRDDSGTDTSTTSDALTVVVNEPPVANAGPDQTVSSSEVHFDGTGSHDPDGKIAVYAWNFGDGTTGGGPTPVHVYKTAGGYRVRLTVTDDSGTVRNTASDDMNVVINAPPIADAGPDQVGAPGQPLNFVAAGSLDPDGDVAQYIWSFKDGATATGPRVTHKFDRPGVYNVRLAVKDNTDQAKAVDYAEAKVTINAPPVARAGPDQRAAPGDAVTFDASNSFDPDGGTLTYRWDFSDQSQPFFGRQVVRAYKAPGVYNAQLTVTDDSGAINSVSRDQAEIRINHQPVASAGSDIDTWHTTITFDGRASADADGDPLTYSWDFGDGTPAGSGAVVTHTYADGGSYPVKLTVDDGTGLWNARASAAITVTINRPPLAVAGPNKEVCAGDIVVFDGSGSSDPDGGLLRYHWNFGDGGTADIVNPTRIFTKGAAYPVTLTVQDESGFPNDKDTSRMVVKVHESPIARAGPDQEVCAGTEVQFDGSASHDPNGAINRFSWDFGDGATGGGEKPVHVYSRPGDYRVLLSIEGNKAGQCNNTNTNEMHVKVDEAPVARIAGPSAVPVGAVASFDASPSSGATAEIQSWRWDFGDGATAEGTPTVQHVYKKAGAYLVRLTIGTNAVASECSATSTQHAVVANAPPVADPGGERLVGVDQDVLFDGSGSHDPDGQITSWTWDFGDGTTASGVNVRHRYRASGKFPVTLTVTDDTELANNTASAKAIVTVNAPPEPVIAGPSAVCPRETVAFDGRQSRDADGEIARYLWHFGDGASAEGAQVTHSYKAAGHYPLALVADDGRGLNNSRQQANLDLHVNRPPQPMAGPDRLVCPGEAVSFDGSSSVDWDGKLVRYLWDFGDGSTAEGAKVEHSYQKPGSYEAKLTVTDDSGSSCARVSDVAEVTVDAPPVAVAGPDRQGFVGGAYDQLLFDASASSDPDGRPLTYVWDLGDGVTRTGEKVLHAYGKPGEYKVRLSVSDGTGLACGQSFSEIKVDARSHDQVSLGSAGKTPARQAQR
jgi:PKD repeat protein